MTEHEPRTDTESAEESPDPSVSKGATPVATIDDARAIGPGDCLGRYTVQALIGTGGMGRVFAATDSELGRTVALKVIRPDRGPASSYARARLMREAQALAVLHHPNVVTVHDVGTEGENVFVAMELIDGSTLGDWLRAEPRTWRAIRDVFLAAGRGLAAAHAAGIVHRDFKPHNVIVGSGRVVVVDFGLARANPDLPEEPGAMPPPGGPSSHGNLSLSLTLTGERVGTPQYMPPEQREGGVVTAKADQFAFCVALHEAVFGWRPGERSAASTLPRVPRFLAAAIARGLMPRADARWPSMDALLAALGRTWTPRRKRLAGATAAVMVIAVAVLGFTAGQRASAPDPCAGGEALIAPLWNDTARSRVRDAFRRTGRSYADDTFVRADAGLRQRLTGWAQAYRDNCQATHVRHEQSEAMLDLRARCLRSAKAELSGLVSALQEADATVLDRATRAVGDVGDPARCSDPASLGAAIPPPPAALVHDVEAMREQIVRGWLLVKLGKWNEARSLARDLVVRARRLDYKPLLAKALSQLGDVEADTGDNDAAIRDLYEAAQLGTEVADDDLVATSLPWLEIALGYGKDQYEAADAVYRWATAAVARAGNTPTRLVGLFGNHAEILNRRGDHQGALELYRTVLGLESARRGPESLEVARALGGIGEQLGRTGHGRDAESYFERSSTLMERFLGSEHPIVATQRYKRAWNLLELFEPDDAILLLERARAIYEKNLGRTDRRVAATVYGLGIAFLEQRRLPEARAAVEQAIEINRAKDPEGRSVAGNYEVLGDIARQEGNPLAAHEFAQRALAIKLKVLGPDHEELGTTYRLDADHLVALGRLGEASAAVARALEIDEKAEGKNAPEAGWAFLVQGHVLRAQRRAREAIKAYETSLHILETAYGTSFPGLCQPLAGLTAALLEVGDARRAQELAERELILAAKAPPGEVGAAEFRLAHARWVLGADRPAARALARQARAHLAALPFPSEELPRIDRWLKTVK